MNTEPPITIRDLYPDFTEEQLQEAEANLERYLRVIIRIAERLEAEGYTPADLDLTARDAEGTLSVERSKP
jgi:hypothetical protein